MAVPAAIMMSVYLYLIITNVRWRFQRWQERELATFEFRLSSHCPVCSQEVSIADNKVCMHQFKGRICYGSLTPRKN